MAKQHEKRFIIEFKNYAEKWVRSSNPGISGFFSTKEEAQAAITPDNTSSNLTYHVRQK